MTGKKDLVTVEDAAETLGLDDAEVASLIESGDLRKIWHRAGNSSDSPLDSFVLGSDVTRLQKQNDPRYMAKLVAGEIVEPNEDGDTPQTLAAKVQRL